MLRNSVINLSHQRRQIPKKAARVANLGLCTGVVGMEKKHWAGMARDACVCIYWFQSLCDSHFWISLLLFYRLRTPTKRARRYKLKGEPNNR